MMTFQVRGLYYITHIDNLASILQFGILSHRLIEQQKVKFTAIYDAEIVSRRENITTPQGKSLWDYANLYFQPRNPMLYRIKEEVGYANIVVIKIRKDILTSSDDILITTGNAASDATEMSPYGTQALKNISKFLDLEYWNKIDGSNRKIMAECLVPNLVPPSYIEAVHVPNSSHTPLERVQRVVNHTRENVHVTTEPKLFFQPEILKKISHNISLAKGDMFYSKLQTLTISVNTVGVMGKGLASTSKYQFPDVYVAYQDLCKSKKLRVGKPAIIKREVVLSDIYAEMDHGAQKGTWFLLFPTKAHWRDDSKIEYIVDGMGWLDQHYKKEGIESLALPALGCGLGNLEWKQVAPVICSVVKHWDIQTCIYLPNESTIPDEYLQPEFLLG
jgi:O-acetyl-ADP-ribose deacetylase (regulator of RNase III)